MSKHVKHVPKHRAPATRPTLGEAPRKAVRTTLILSSVAVAATGATVGGGIVANGPGVSNAAAGIAQRPSAKLAGDVDIDIADRGKTVSRSLDTEKADPKKKAALSTADGPATVQSENLSQSDPRDIARALLSEFGFSADQFGCLDSLYMRESGWNVYADNPSSSAYGIPQSLPGSKMASAGADWETNPVTQIRWGLGYIQDRYGSPCGAWGHSQSVGWY